MDQVHGNQMPLDSCRGADHIVSQSAKVLKDSFSPPYKAARLYSYLGVVVTRNMKEKNTPIIQVSPGIISQGFKNHGMSNAARRLMQQDSQQFAWMSKVLKEVFKVGVLVNDDSLLFIDLSSVAVSKAKRKVTVVDIDSVFSKISPVECENTEENDNEQKQDNFHN